MRQGAQRASVSNNAEKIDNEHRTNTEHARESISRDKYLAATTEEAFRQSEEQIRRLVEQQASDSRGFGCPLNRGDLSENAPAIRMDNTQLSQNKRTMPGM